MAVAVVPFEPGILIPAATFVPAAGSPEFKAPKIEAVEEDEEIQTDVEEIKRDNIQVDPKVTPAPPVVPAPAAPAVAPAKPTPAAPAKPKK